MYVPHVHANVQSPLNARCTARSLSRIVNMHPNRSTLGAVLRPGGLVALKWKPYFFQNLNSHQFRHSKLDARCKPFWIQICLTQPSELRISDAAFIPHQRNSVVSFANEFATGNTNMHCLDNDLQLTLVPSRVPTLCRSQWRPCPTLPTATERFHSPPVHWGRWMTQLLSPDT